EQRYISYKKGTAIPLIGYEGTFTKEFFEEDTKSELEKAKTNGLWEVIKKQAQAQGVNPLLLLALAIQEKYGETPDKSAKGWFQLQSDWEGFTNLKELKTDSFTEQQKQILKDLQSNDKKTREAAKIAAARDIEISAALVALSIKKQIKMLVDIRNSRHLNISDFMIQSLVLGMHEQPGTIENVLRNINPAATEEQIIQAVNFNLLDWISKKASAKHDNTQFSYYSSGIKMYGGGITYFENVSGRLLYLTKLINSDSLPEIGSTIARNWGSKSGTAEEVAGSYIALPPLISKALEHLQPKLPEDPKTPKGSTAATPPTIAAIPHAAAYTPPAKTTSSPKTKASAAPKYPKVISAGIVPSATAPLKMQYFVTSEGEKDTLPKIFIQKKSFFSIDLSGKQDENKAVLDLWDKLEKT
ncbi:hypothetical protein EBR43_09555, partial [bacterium]|nr:hypothetical protein [bacterium]